MRLQVDIHSRYVCKGGLISEGIFSSVLVIENFCKASVPQLFSLIIPKVKREIDNVKLKIPSKIKTPLL